MSNKSNKIGRNALCYCGSGKKYKHCHYEIDKSKKKGIIKLKPEEGNMLSHLAHIYGKKL